MSLLILFGGAGEGVPPTVAEYALLVHAGPTDMLLHAEQTAGKINTIYVLMELTDENGDLLTDEDGDVLTAYGETGALVLHAHPTDSLLHAEATI